MSNAHKLTKQQQLALRTRDVSVALDAGAGCGKTFVLTERFLSHLAPGDDALDLGELVAITFTEAAASEMRQRVRDKCLDRLADAPKDQAEYWLRLLRLLDGARISTIHSFCSTLVRSHALELGLDPGFSVLDQAAADVMLSESSDDYLRMALDKRDDDVRNLAVELGPWRAQEPPDAIAGARRRGPDRLGIKRPRRDGLRMAGLLSPAGRARRTPSTVPIARDPKDPRPDS